MRRALAVCVSLSFTAPPLGLFLTFKRMSLVGDAMSHSLLPGVALGFLWSGSTLAMSLGGLAAGLLVILASSFLGKRGGTREETSIAVFYLFALAAGVLLISVHGSQADLFHLLFGSVLTIDNGTLIGAGISNFFLLIVLTFFSKLFFTEGFDPLTLTLRGQSPRLIQILLLVLVTICLVSAFQAIGTLMAIGILIIPAAASRFLSRNFLVMALSSMFFSFLSCALGLVASFHLNLPVGPSIIGVMALVYTVALLSRSPRTV